MDFLGSIQAYWRPAFEVGVFWFAYYLLFVYIKDSGMMQALKGIVLLVAFFFLSQYLELKAIRWVLSHLFQISIIGILIIFQTELRRGLTRIGQSPLFKMFLKEERVMEDVVKAAVAMSQARMGALIAIEREVTLKPYAESGTPLDAILTSELLLSIFTPNAPFHDGGAIIQGGRVAAASCLFPLSQSQTLSKSLGTRHRAALGLSEETDAFVIVISEETGVISVMTGGKASRGIDESGLRGQLADLLQTQKAEKRSKKLSLAGKVN